MLHTCTRARVHGRVHLLEANPCTRCTRGRISIINTYENSPIINTYENPQYVIFSSVSSDAYSAVQDESSTPEQVALVRVGIKPSLAATYVLIECCSRLVT